MELAGMLQIVLDKQESEGLGSSTPKVRKLLRRIRFTYRNLDKVV